MRIAGWSRTILVALFVLGAAKGSALATCVEYFGYPIFQCANEAHFAPAPFTINLDSNHRPTNVSTVFWQIGFGNEAVKTGTGSAGTGMESPTSFNGNDSGLRNVDIVDFSVGTGDASPSNALCIWNENWKDPGIDGCCDNNRTTNLLFSNDFILNPLYDVYYTRNGGPGYYSSRWVQDYPMAFLLKDAGDNYFAFAAVASMKRDNNPPGGSDDCTVYPHTGNPAACDPRTGFYDLSDVSNGNLNPNVTGKNNVIPWQATPVPVPVVASITCANPGVSPSQLNVTLTWDGVETYSDQSVRPSGNDTLAPQDSTRAAGVGVNDIITKFQGLVRYRIEKAPSPSFSPATLINESFENPARLSSDPNPTQAAILGMGECAHISTLFGKKPETAAYSLADCRVGKCGDVGYEVESNWACFDVDVDGDQVDDTHCDNCRTKSNMDQLDTDNDSYGDVCDPCAADPTNACDPQKTVGLSVGPGGGCLETPDGSVTMTVPAGALTSDTSLSITGGGSLFEITDGVLALYAVTILKSGQTFNVPVTLVFAWPDADNNGVVDGTSIIETALVIYKNGAPITMTCGASAGCDTTTNTFSVQVNSLSQFALASLIRAGEVPDGSGPETPLRVESVPGGDIRLSWGASCVSSDTDYEVYQGSIGNFTSHTPISCSTGGSTSMTFTPSAGSSYYLVVPRNALREGSYGRRSNGGERAPAASACLPQSIGTCL